MIYDLKAGRREMRTHGNPICRGSPQRHRDHRDGPKPVQKAALTLCTLCLCGEHLCKTNPIRSRTGRGAIAPNKPNCPKRGTEAASAGRLRPRRGEMCKTKPIPGHAGGAGDEGQMRETKPNQGELGYLGDRTVAGRAQGKCAKQTQFARRGRGRRPWDAVQTKPIPAGGTRQDHRQGRRP